MDISTYILIRLLSLQLTNVCKRATKKFQKDLLSALVNMRIVAHFIFLGTHSVGIGHIIFSQPSFVSHRWHRYDRHKFRLTVITGSWGHSGFCRGWGWRRCYQFAPEQ